MLRNEYRIQVTEERTRKQVHYDQQWVWLQVHDINGVVIHNTILQRGLIPDEIAMAVSRYERFLQATRDDS